MKLKIKIVRNVDLCSEFKVIDSETGEEFTDITDLKIHFPLKDMTKIDFTMIVEKMDFEFEGDASVVKSETTGTPTDKPGIVETTNLTDKWCTFKKVKK